MFSFIKELTTADRGLPGDHSLSTLLLNWSMLLIVVTAVALFFHTMFQVYLLYTPVPWGDMVTDYRWLEAKGLHFTDLFRPANEHIIPFPRLLYLIDLYLFSATGAFLVSMNFVLCLAIAIVFYYVAKKTFFTSQLDALLYLFILMIGYVNCRHAINFIFGYNVVHWIEILLLLIFAYLFAKMCCHARKSEWSRVLVLILISFVAVFSCANGIVCLATALLIGIVLRIRWNVLLPFAITLIAFVIFYKWMNPLASAKLEVIFKNPLASMQFFLTFLGSPYLRYHTWPADAPFWTFRPWVAATQGGIILILGTLLSWRVLLQGKGRDVFSVFHVFIFIFVVATGVLAITARLHLDLYEGANSKYVNTVLLAWISVFSLLVGFLAEFRTLSRRRRNVAWLGACIILVSMVLPAHFREIKVWGQWNKRLWQTASYMMAGVYDRDFFCIYHEPEGLFRVTQTYLRPRNLTIFHYYNFKIGDNINNHFKVIRYPCLYAFEIKQPIGTPGQAQACQVQGWAWDIKAQRPIKDLILTEASGTIIGVAHTTRSRPDIAANYSYKAMKDSGWLGVTRPVDPSQKIMVYGIVDKKKGNVCILGEK